jgi:UDP-2,3-diacylglucosamine pyrophosphatase LpxH
MNNAAETMSQPFTSTSGCKSGRKLLQVLEHRPEQPFSQRRVEALIGMRKIVTVRSRRPTQSRKWIAVQSQRVTDVVQTDSVGQLCKDHAHHMTPRAEGSRTESTPVSRASFGTRCGGIRLHSCRRTVNLGAVGLVFLFFTSVE